MKSKPFSDLEKAYIRRVAGRVPVAFISMHLGREVKSIRDFCVSRKILTKVPTSIMKKYRSEYLPKRQRA